MTIETTIYAMLGIHCKDVCTTKTESVRGCNHRLTEDKFCPECGEKMWVDEKTRTYLSDKLKHLQPWQGDEETGTFCYEKLSIIYGPMVGPVDFMIGRVLGEFDTAYEGIAKEFHVLSVDEYDAVKAETKALLEPLGLWDENKFGWRLYSLSS